MAAGVDAGGPDALAVARIVVGAAFLGAITDAMLLGHWYLVQPGLTRDPLHELLTMSTVLWFPEILVLLWPVGMVSMNFFIGYRTRSIRRASAFNWTR